MNKLYLTLFLITGLTGISNAQSENPHALTGKPYSYVESFRQFYVSNPSGYLIIKLSGKKVILQKIGTDLSLQKAMQYESFPKSFRLEQVVTLRGKCYIFYSALTEKSGVFSQDSRLSMFVAQADVARGELLDAGKEILSTSGETSPEEFTKKTFQILISDDSSQFAVCYRLKSTLLNKSKSYETNGIWVFTDQLTERWHSEFVLPYTERKCNVRGRGIDTNGNVHTVVGVINDESGLEKKYGQDTPNYSLEVLSYQSASAAPVVTPLNLEGKFLKSISFNGSIDKLMCSGFYNSGHFNDNPEGIFTATFTPSVSGKATLHPFPLALVNEGEGKFTQKTNESRVAKKKPLDIDDLELVKTIIQPDGGILFLGEERTAGTGGGYVATPGVGTGGYYSGGSSPFFGNIVVARFLSDGSLLWIRKLLKAEVSYSNDPTMFQYSHKNGRYNFYFIEDEEFFAYQLSELSGEGEKKMLTKLKPLLKKPAVVYSVFPERLIVLPDGKGATLEALLKGDAGQFGESKPYKEEVLVKISVD